MKESALRPSRKLDLKFAGPYKVLSAIGKDAVTYKLELPDSLAIHNAFHASLLLPASTNPLPGQVLEPPPPINVKREGATHTEWEVEKILDAKEQKQRGRVARGTNRPGWVIYRVKWKGYDEPTWHPSWDLLPGSEEALVAYHRRYPGKPIPLGFVMPPEQSAGVQLHAVTTVPQLSTDEPVRPLATAPDSADAAM